MRKAVIFGTGSTGIQLYERISRREDVLFFVDNDEKRWGSTLSGISNPSIEIKPPSELTDHDFDVVYIASLPALELIHNQLLNELKIPAHKIVRSEVELIVQARVQFLKSFAEYCCAQGISGDVCEVGVFQGEFAKEINAAFPDRTCYLFDTFEGFDERDIAVEDARNFTTLSAGYLSTTSVDLVLDKMPNRDMCVIKKGFFPDTFDIPDKSFCFVNLDPDLYKPIIDGLMIFYPRLVHGGVILVHDYFNRLYPGVKAAVDEFAAQEKLYALPIGDGYSVAIHKNRD